jgi:hypothetical protein
MVYFHVLLSTGYICQTFFLEFSTSGPRDRFNCLGGPADTPVATAAMAFSSFSLLAFCLAASTAGPLSCGQLARQQKRCCDRLGGGWRRYWLRRRLRRRCGGWDPENRYFLGPEVTTERSKCQLGTVYNNLEIYIDMKSA